MGMPVRKAKRTFVRDFLAGIREVCTPGLIATYSAVVLGVGLLVWLGTKSDPRVRACGKPSDAQIILYFLALPVLLGTSIVGLGEASLWSRLRQGSPRRARGHGWRAAGLLAVAATIAAAAGLGFASLCGF